MPFFDKLIPGKDKGAAANDLAADASAKDPKKALRGKPLAEQAGMLTPGSEAAQAGGGGSAGRIKERFKATGAGAIGSLKAGVKAVGGGAVAGAQGVGQAIGSAKDGVASLVKGGAREQDPTPAPAAADAPKDTKAAREREIALASAAQMRVAAEFGPEVAAWLASQAQEPEFKKAVKPGAKKSEADYFNGVLEFVKNAQHEHAGAKSGAELDAIHAGNKGGNAAGLSRGAFKHDPFHYDLPALPKDEIESLKKLGLSNDELLAVTLYCSQAAYPMNQVMRGELRDPEAVKAYLPWALKLDSALSKLPPTVRNMQMGGDNHTAHPLIDPSKPEDAMLHIKDVPLFRSDTFSGHFIKEVLANWRVGSRIVNPTFLSTTTLRGSYTGMSGLTRIMKVKNSKSAASIMNLSSSKFENEVLFRPNTAMKITKITQLPGKVVKANKAADPKAKYNTDLTRVGTLADKYEVMEREDSGVRDVNDFSKSYTPQTLPQHEFEVEATIEEAPGGADKAPAPAPPKKDDKGGGQLTKKAKDPQQLLDQQAQVAAVQVLRKFKLPIK